LLDVGTFRACLVYAALVGVKHDRPVRNILALVDRAGRFYCAELGDSAKYVGRKLWSMLTFPTIEPCFNTANAPIVLAFPTVDDSIIDPVSMVT
jgi:hypothetical protein